MNIYLIVKRDETGKVSESRVPQDDLASYIAEFFRVGGNELLAVIRL